MIALIIICVGSFINKASCLDPIFLRQTPKHGTNNGTSVNSFSCPGNAAITSIKYSTDTLIRSLEFTCSSPDGNVIFGPYGTVKGTVGNFTCPKGEYISSLYGNSSDFLSHFGVRCRPVNKDLKGNGADLGRMVNGTDPKVGAAFDDLAYSNGARIVNVTIWSSVEIKSIRFGYGNIPVELCTVNCSNYKEESTPLYGSTGDKNTKLAVYTCPDDGAAIGLITKISGGTAGKVLAIQFTCISSSGTGVTPPLGQAFEANTSGLRVIQCPTGLIIGSTHGKYGSKVNALGIQCVEVNVTNSTIKYDAQGGTDGTSFDDVKFPNDGYRPMQFRIYYDGNGITGIQTKYGNSLVSGNCRVTKIEVIDTTVKVKSDGRQLIGLALGTSCWKEGKQLLKLQYSHEIEDSVSVDAASGGDENWDKSLAVEGSLDVEGVAAASLGYSHTWGGSRHYSSTKSNTKSTSSGHSASEEITYNTPGACAIIGYISRYTIDRDNIAARYHYDCEVGVMRPRIGSINFKSTTYGNAYFEDYQFNFTDMAACDRKSRDCVKQVEANTVNSNISSFSERFFQCRN